MLINKQEIAQYIPQKPPFMFVNALHKADEEEFLTTFEITEDCVLVESGELKEVGFIENMAQTVAAGFSYLERTTMSADSKPKIGFIGSVNRFKVNRKVKVGETLSTSIKLQMSFENITLVAGEVNVGDETVASCELKIAIVDDLGL